MQEMGLSAMCTLFTSEPAGDTNIVKKARTASAFSLQGEHTEEKKADLLPHLLVIAKQRPESQEFFNITTDIAESVFSRSVLFTLPHDIINDPFLL